MRGVRALVAVAVPSLLLLGCAGVGSKSAEAPTKGASAYGGTPQGPLKVMGFSGEDEVAQSRIAAFKQSAPKVRVTNNKGDFDAQQFLTTSGAATHRISSTWTAIWSAPTPPRAPSSR